MGHFLGLFTHDVGECYFRKDKDGNETEVPCVSPISKNIVLEKGMMLTIEPGIYFHQVLIDKYAADEEKKEFIDFDKVKEYFLVGGVRIEDDIVVTEDGYENMSILPRTVEEIEAFMASE